MVAYDGGAGVSDFTGKGKFALIVDLGMNTALCRVFVDAGFDVYYTSPGADQSCPTIAPLHIGEGIKGVERVNDPHEILNRTKLPDDDENYIDKDDLLVVFPDVGQGSFQDSLRFDGFKVWGSANAAFLELDRITAKSIFEDTGISIGPYEIVRGVTAAKDYLQDNPNKWVKVSMSRGDWESTFATTFASIETQLDKFALKLGPLREEVDFIMEDAIKDSEEICYDLYSVDGEYPDKAIVGVECKGKAWIGHVLPYDKVPKQIADTNAKIAPLHEEYQMRSWGGMEMRIDPKGNAFVIDPLERGGVPGFTAAQLAVKNMARVMWEGSTGKLVQPAFEDEWIVEVLICAEHWAEDNWTWVNYPAKHEANVRLQRQYGMKWVAPGSACIGSVVACGPSMKSAIASAKDICEKITGTHAVSVDDGCLDKIVKSIEKLASFGVKL